MGALELSFPIKEMDFISGGEAASRIKDMLKQIGLDPTLIRRASISAYEMEMNLVIHARRGVLKASITPGLLTIESADEGPGIADVNLAMKEGFSTAPQQVREMGFGAGMGLPNIKRCSDDFHIASGPDQGTHVKAVFRIPNQARGE